MTGVKLMSFRAGSKIIFFVVNTTDTTYPNVKFTIYGINKITSSAVTRKVWTADSQLDGINATSALTGVNTFTESVGPKRLICYSFDVN